MTPRTLKDRVLRQIMCEYPYTDVEAEAYLTKLKADELLQYVSYEIEGMLLELEARVISRFAVPGGD